MNQSLGFIVLFLNKDKPFSSLKIDETLGLKESLNWYSKFKLPNFSVQNKISLNKKTLLHSIISKDVQPRNYLIVWSKTAEKKQKNKKNTANMVMLFLRRETFWDNCDFFRLIWSQILIRSFQIFYVPIGKTKQWMAEKGLASGNMASFKSFISQTLIYKC